MLPPLDPALAETAEAYIRHYHVAQQPHADEMHALMYAVTLYAVLPDLMEADHREPVATVHDRIAERHWNRQVVFQHLYRVRFRDNLAFIVQQWEKLREPDGW